MNRSTAALAFASALVLSSGVAFAQGHGGGHGKPATATTKATPQGPKTTTHGQSGATHGKSGATHGQSGATHGQSGATHGQSGTAHGKPATATPQTTTTTAGTTLTLTPVQQKLQQNTNLAGKLQSRLPAGTNLMTASEGFRNLGQFVAAVNVSNNLGIPFVQLKTRMVDENMSLGQAIQSVRADVDVTTEVRRAEADANRLISTTTTTTPKKNKGR
jgi:hypothetical protein